MNLVIRKASPSDAAEIANILTAQKVFSATLPAEDRLYVRTKTRIEECLPDRDAILVGELGGHVVGYGAVRWFPGLILAGPDAYLSELFIHPEFRGQGIGSQILAELREQSKARGSTRLWCINLRTRDSYQRGYYRKAGWEEKDIAVFFEDLCR